MKRRMCIGVFGCALATFGALAQATEEITLGETNTAWDGRWYLLQAHGHSSVSGDWRSSSVLRAYAKAHPEGDYLVFLQAGTLYRLNTPAEIARLADFQQPMDALAAVQDELSTSMVPLSAAQLSLGSAMRDTHSPQMMGRIGHEQGIVGARQGEIGRQQGIIGHQQGVLGRAFYQSTQRVIDHCLTEKTCAAIAPAAPAAASR